MRVTPGKKVNDRGGRHAFRASGEFRRRERLRERDSEKRHSTIEGNSGRIVRPSNDRDRSPRGNISRSNVSRAVVRAIRGYRDGDRVDGLVALHSAFAANARRPVLFTNGANSKQRNGKA